MGHGVRVLLLLVVLVPVAPRLLEGATLSLAWDQSPDRDVVGYVVRGGLAPGSYMYSLDVGGQTSLHLAGLPDNLTLYLVVEAYTAGGRRSAPSNEIVWSPSSNAGTRSGSSLRSSLTGSGSSRLRYEPGSGSWSLELDRPDGARETRTGIWPSNRVLYGLDMNGDGLRDVLLHDVRTGEWTASVRDGDGYTEVDRGAWEPGLRPLVADLNRDGYEDVSLYDPSGGTTTRCVRAILGRDAFACTSERPEGAARPYVADFDGDGAADRLSIDRLSGEWSLDLGSGGTARGVWPALGEVHLGDLDADRATDVVIYEPTTGDWVAFPATGHEARGRWNTRELLVLTDLNHDGRADANFIDLPSGALRMLAGNPDAPFTGSPGPAPVGVVLLDPEGGDGHAHAAAVR